MRHNRCESDITMLKGCKQPDRNIASSNSCVALVMIFQEALTESLQNALLSHSQTRKSLQNKRPCAHGRVAPHTASHVVIHNPPSTLAKSFSPPQLLKRKNIGHFGSKNGCLSLGLARAWNRLYITLAKQQQPRNFPFFVVAHFSSPFVAVI